MTEENLKTKNQSPSEKLRDDYVNQLNEVKAKLTKLETERQRLVTLREQLKGAIFALDKINTLNVKTDSEESSVA